MWVDRALALFGLIVKKKKHYKFGLRLRDRTKRMLAPRRRKKGRRKKQSWPALKKKSVGCLCYSAWWARWVCWTWRAQPRPRWGRWPWRGRRGTRCCTSPSWAGWSGVTASSSPRWRRGPRPLRPASSVATRWVHVWMVRIIVVRIVMIIILYHFWYIASPASSSEPFTNSMKTSNKKEHKIHSQVTV